jgi:general secretion pathway protein G
VASDVLAPFSNHLKKSQEPMKSNPRNGKAAFTLIELMAVITIIVILAGLVVGGLGFVTERQAKEKARVQHALLMKGLEAYKLDMGLYPPSTNSTDGNNLSATCLYIPLFYEGYNYGKQATPPTNWVGATTIYISDLDPTTTQQGWVTKVQPPATPPPSTPVTDPWGNQYRYRSAKNAAGSTNGNTINPDFDLWSVGKNGTSNPAANSSTNDKKSNADDIRNF